MTARGESTKQTSERVSKRAHNHYLYQACSRGDGYNLTRFGSPEPGLIFTYRKKVAWATKKWGSRRKSPGSSKGLQHFQCKIPSKFVLFHFITHSSYNFSPIEKKRRNNYMDHLPAPPMSKVGVQGAKPRGSSRGLQHILCKILAKFVVF